MNKTRLDALLTERGLVESLEHARAVIMSGSVFIEGQRADKPGKQISVDADVQVREKKQYVSRGGLKLERALEFFGVSPRGKVCIDCGASTGGFTDCLLKNGARLVYAVDVGYGQLAWSIRNDPRVIVMERTNIRNVTADLLATEPELAAIDLSFISLEIVLPVVRDLLTQDGHILCLIKPQFEADREKVEKKGVVRSPETHMDVLAAFLRNALKLGFCIKDLTYSPVRGPEGNIEYLGWLRCRGDSDAVDVAEIVSESHRVLS